MMLTNKRLIYTMKKAVILIFLITLSANSYSCDLWQDKNSGKWFSSGDPKECNLAESIESIKKDCNEKQSKIIPKNKARVIIFKDHTIVKEMANSYRCNYEDGYFLYDGNRIINVKNGKYSLYITN